MFLSIIIPVYNCEKYLNDCLDSCFEQDIDKDDYEVICVNDGSTDSSLEILRDYQKNHPNLVVINQKNSGQTAARKAGVDIANGEYLWFVDSDDFIAPNCLTKIKNLSEENYDLINFNGFRFNEKESRDFAIKKLCNCEKIQRMYLGSIALHIFKKIIIQCESFLLFPELRYGEDEMFYVFLNEFACKVYYFDNVLYFYRQRKDSVMGRLKYSIKQRRKRMEDIISSMEILKDKLLLGKFKKKFSLELMCSRYELSKIVLAQFRKIEGQRYFNIMVRKGFFDQELLMIINLQNMNKKTFEKDYLRLYPVERKKLIKKAFRKRLGLFATILPQSLQERIKRIV